MASCYIATHNETGEFLKMTPQPAYMGKRFRHSHTDLDECTSFAGEGQFIHQCEQAGIDPAEYDLERTYGEPCQ